MTGLIVKKSPKENIRIGESLFYVLRQRTGIKVKFKGKLLKNL